jgi:hypothetical protein
MSLAAIWGCMSLWPAAGTGGGSGCSTPASKRPYLWMLALGTHARSAGLLHPLGCVDDLRVLVGIQCRPAC